MNHRGYAYIEKSFSARFISDFPYSGPPISGPGVSGPAGGGASAQFGISIDTDPALLVWVNGTRISSIELLYDPTQFYVSPADLTLNPMFRVPASQEGDVGVTTVFKSDRPTDLREHHLTIFPYQAGSRPGAVTLMPPDIIGRPDWLKMRIKGGYRETAIFRKGESRPDRSGEFIFDSVSRGAVY
ncbi:hypothetical protein FBZ89_11887 [Nitrospirillum amazonense]|uniref:Uncharacterized protein n=2 Tax=Nitrospirillum amazonense TaxID=28077 RepID=A0A560EXS2_9PROT|nr:hypothetical protein FBZ89_11887 [Nitrospirillum amazonense]